MLFLAIIIMVAGLLNITFREKIYFYSFEIMTLVVIRKSIIFFLKGNQLSSVNSIIITTLTN